MKTTIYPVIIGMILILLCLPSAWINTNAQAKAEIANVDFQVVNDNLVVTYDLLKAKKNELFNIKLIITAVTGKTYLPVTVSGDIGDNISGGKGKQIIWEITKDNVFINEEIFVEVKATPMVPQAVTTPVQEPVYTEQTEQKEVKPPTEKNISKGGAIALSAICPGIGITKMKGGGAYWLLCLPTYGAAIGGVVFALTANSQYEKYKEATTAADRDNYFNKAKSQGTISIIMYIAAGSIWAINMIWTAATPNRPSPKYSFGASLDPLSGKPMVSFNYRF
jgi:hypothetical protein